MRPCHQKDRQVSSQELSSSVWEDLKKDTTAISPTLLSFAAGSKLSASSSATSSAALASPANHPKLDHGNHNDDGRTATCVRRPSEPGMRRSCSECGRRK
ncbi:unnamed protein product, partial [Ectocarpus sp. 8 AP-2014]